MNFKFSHIYSVYIIQLKITLDSSFRSATFRRAFSDRYSEDETSPARPAGKNLSFEFPDAYKLFFGLNNHKPANLEYLSDIIVKYRDAFS